MLFINYHKTVRNFQSSYKTINLGREREFMSSIDNDFTFINEMIVLNFFSPFKQWNFQNNRIKIRLFLNFCHFEDHVKCISPYKNYWKIMKFNLFSICIDILSINFFWLKNFIYIITALISSFLISVFLFNQGMKHTGWNKYDIKYYLFFLDNIRCFFKLFLYSSNSLKIYNLR